jgi:divalent metal cation (Fe/Co/Zn/Cd) transporter
MPESRWYENSILESPWVHASWVVGLGAFVVAYFFHWPWKDTLAVVIFLAVYIEFDVSTRQIEKLMDRVKELEEKMRSMEAAAKN